MAETDSTPSLVIDDQHQTNNQLETPVQLQFPQLLLEASFESLLTHSTCSSGSTVTMAQPGQDRGLGESWASLDPTEYSQDDAQSELTDTSSLIEVSSTTDNDSVLVEEEEENKVNAETAEAREGHRSVHETRQQEDDDEPLFFIPLKMQSNSDSIDVKYDRNFYEGSNSKSCAAVVQESLRMTISKESFSVHNRPFNVAYSGSSSTIESKEYVLRKVAAASLPSTVDDTPQASIQAPRFNIVPTEFGRGSQPSFADLIPSQAQLALNDMTIIEPTFAPRPRNVTFALKHSEERYESTSPGIVRQVPQEDWRPELLVVHVGVDDAAEDFYTVQIVLNLAKRHCWPVITIVEDNVQGFPEAWCEGITKSQWIRTPAQDVYPVTQPINVDDFLMIDTAQLNKHIAYLMHDAQQRHAKIRNDDTLLSQVKNVVSGVSNLWKGLPYSQVMVIKKIVADTEVAELDVGKEIKSELGVVAKKMFWEVFDHVCSIPTPLRTGAGTLVTQILGLCIVMLSICVCSMSYLSQTPATNTISLNISVLNPQTPNITSPMMAVPTSTGIPSLQGDPVISTPSSLDKLWEKLNGYDVRKSLKGMTKLRFQPKPKPTKTDWRNQLRTSKENIRLLTLQLKELLPRLADKHHELVDKHKQQVSKLYEVERELKAAAGQVQTQSRNTISLMYRGAIFLQKTSTAIVRSVVSGASHQAESVREMWHKKIDKQKLILSKAQTRAQLLTYQIPQRKNRGGGWFKQD